MAWDLQSLQRIFQLLLRLVAAVIAFTVIKFLYKTYQIRSKHRRLKAQGIPLLPHSLLFGHLPIILQCRNENPPDMNFIAFHSWLAANRKRYFPDLDQIPPVIYLDLWPFFKDPAVVVFDVGSGAQFMNNRNLAKHSITADFIGPLTFNKDILTSEGEQWRKWRTRLNPGFNPRYIVSVIPEIIEEVQVFANSLMDRTGSNGTWGDVFKLEELTTNLTLDIIVRAAVGRRIHEQTSEKGGPLKLALLDQLRLMELGGDVSRSFSLGRMPWHNWEITRNNQTIKEQILPDFQDNMKSGRELAQERTILNRVLKTIRDELGQKTLDMDQEEFEGLLSNLKALVLAGYDTTASMLCWAWKLLQDNPDCLAKLRAEHDEVLGKNPDEAAKILTSSPHLVNSLQYTHAVFKETLRLYPLTFAIRTGTPDFFITVPGSRTKYPTNGWAVWDAIGWIQRDPNVWPRANEFVPERWLVSHSDPLHPAKDAWRPFAMGHRNCIGQELAVVEAKLVLALCVRKFDINEAWDKWDVKEGIPYKDRHMINGQRLYPSGLATMKPKAGMPIHVRVRNF